MKINNHLARASETQKELKGGNKKHGKEIKYCVRSSANVFYDVVCNG